MNGLDTSSAPKGNAHGFSSGSEDAKVDSHLTKDHDTTTSDTTAYGTSTAGGGKLGPAPHTNGPHSSDWKNIIDPRHDANSHTEEIRAEAQAQARAEAEADQRGQMERAEKERHAAISDAKAGAEAEKRAEVDRAVRQAAGEHLIHLDQVRADAVSDADRVRESEGARRAEAERARKEAERRAEEERVNAEAPPSASKGIGKAAKNIARVAHGAGTAVRGTVQGAVDQKLGHHEATKKHQETAVRGERMIAGSEFAHADQKGKMK
jgi:hypothetical protein